MKNIILPIDFSDTTDTLVEGAVDFAKEIAGKIFLIHVAPADIGFAIGDMGFQYFPEIEKSEISEELAELNEIEKRIEKAGFEMMDSLKDFDSNEPGAILIRNYDYQKMTNVTLINNYPSIQCRYETFRNSSRRAACWFKE